MSTPLRRRERQRDVRRAILDAAQELLADGDYEQLSMRRLAERCGYTVPTIYHHFGDKPGLVDAVLEESFAELVRVLERVPQGSDPVANARALARAFVGFGLDSPAHYRLLMTPRIDGSPPPRSSEIARELLDRSLFALHKAGRLRCNGAEVAAQVFWVVTHGLISLRTSRPDYEWDDALFESVMDAMLHGLIADGSQGGEVAR